IDGVGHGAEHDVVIRIKRPSDSATIEVHVLPRGHWTGVRESQSFGIAYEVTRSSAAVMDCEAITEVLAETIRSRDHGLPSPPAIPLGSAFEAGAFRRFYEEGDIGVLCIQVAWVLLILASPVLGWWAGRISGLGSARLLTIVTLCAAVALAVIWPR